MLHALVAVLVSVLLADGASAAQSGPRPGDLEARKLLLALFQREPEGFASAKAPWRFSFPADHAAHPEFWTESWHLTGSAATPRGRRFGFQLTFVRIGVVSPETPLGPSAFAARDVYWAQFALSDAGAGRAHWAERMGRAASGMAGAQQAPVRVWLDDWEMQVSSGAHQDDAFRFSAADENIGLALTLNSAKPPLLPTAVDKSPTGVSVPNPFHAYAMTRLIGKGKVRIGTEAFDVTAQGWLDRAWGRIPAPIGAVVWDRFSVQLDDGRELLAVRTRRRDGGGVPAVTGMMIERDGTARPLSPVQAEIAGYWSNPHGARYPVEWRLAVPQDDLELRLEPIMADQERPLTWLAWAGAMRASGSQRGQRIEGSGYMELAASP